MTFEKESSVNETFPWLMLPDANLFRFYKGPGIKVKRKGKFDAILNLNSARSLFPSHETIKSPKATLASK